MNRDNDEFNSFIEYNELLYDFLGKKLPTVSVPAFRKKPVKVKRTVLDRDGNEITKEIEQMKIVEVSEPRPIGEVKEDVVDEIGRLMIEYSGIYKKERLFEQEKEKLPDLIFRTKYAPNTLTDTEKKFINNLRTECENRIRASYRLSEGPRGLIKKVNNKVGGNSAKFLLDSVIIYKAIQKYELENWINFSTIQKYNAYRSMQIELKDKIYETIKVIQDKYDTYKPSSPGDIGKLTLNPPFDLFIFELNSVGSSLVSFRFLFFKYS